MDITLLARSDRKIIQSYKSGIFKISNETYNHPVLVGPFDVARWDVPEGLSIKDATLDHFNIITNRAEEFDVILLGTGKEITFFSSQMVNDFKDVGLYFDVMDTGAACRTYNVLMAEERRVACLLLPFI